MVPLHVTPPTLLVFLLIVYGVGAQDWAVTYRPNYICALKGSTVIMSCYYSYSPGHRVQTAFWTKSLPLAQGVEPPDLSADLEYKDRVQYLNNVQQVCSLSLSDVRENDQSKYYCRFTTDEPDGKYLGADGVTLSVTDLQVEGPDRVMEGDRVTLTCKTSCSLTNRQLFTWYRNGAALSSRTKQLYLRSVSREDAGRYSCGVWGQNLLSPDVTLNVFYAPVNISISISSSGGIVEGRSVTLTCSSDGNPPVEYTWFKGTSFVAKGNIFTLNKISSVNNGEYKCRSSNEHGVKYSDTVTLNVLYPPRISVSITFSGETLESSSVTLTCSSDGNPPVNNYDWFKEGGGSSPVGSGHSYSFILDSESSGWYYCKTLNEHGLKRSLAVPVTLPDALQGDCSLGRYVGVGVGLCGVAVIMAVVFVMWNKKKKRKVEEHNYQNVGPNPQDDTYTALDPMSRSSNDVYNTLATVHSDHV